MAVLLSCAKHRRLHLSQNVHAYTVHAWVDGAMYASKELYNELKGVVSWKRSGLQGQALAGSLRQSPTETGSLSLSACLMQAFLRL